MAVDDRQKKALTAFSLLLVAGGTAFLVWLSIAVVTGASRGNVWPGRMFMLLISDWNSASGVFKGLATLLSVGVAYVSAYKMKDWLYFAIVAVSVVGFFAAAYLFFEVTSVSTAKSFWPYSPTDKLQDYNSFVAAARVGLGVLCGWFIGVIAAEVGVRIGQ